MIFNTKMKTTIYMICALLSMTISTLVLADKGAVPKTNKTESNNITDLRSIPGNVITTPSKSAYIGTGSPPTEIQSITTVNTTSDVTTPISSITTTAVPTSNTLVNTSNTITSSTTPKITSPTAKTNDSTSIVTPTNIAASKTTAVPLSTSSYSKDRQFDGLSFFGGIILTTCLMAIAAFSWKFYRQCKEGNYRTL